MDCDFGRVVCIDKEHEDWYVDLRCDGTVLHSGFGFERIYAYTAGPPTARHDPVVREAGH